MERNDIERGIDKNGDKNVSPTNGVTPLVSKKALILAKWLAIVVFIVVFILCMMKMGITFLESIQSWVNTLAIVFAAYVGGAYIIDTSKKECEAEGRTYYTESYRSFMLIGEIRKYNHQYSEEQHRVAAEAIVDMLKNEEQKYWNLVFYLQESDINFLRVWNDFNFYFKKSKKSICNSRYFDMVRKYVYMKVYEKNNSVLDKEEHIDKKKRKEFDNPSNESLKLENLETIETRRSTRMQALIAIIAILITGCTFLYNCVRRTVMIWPDSGFGYYSLICLFFIIPLAGIILVFADVLEFILVDLNRYNLKKVDYLQYDEIADNRFAKLIMDFKVVVGIEMIVLFAFVVVSCFMSGWWNKWCAIIVVCLVEVCFLIMLVRAVKQGKINLEIVVDTVSTIVKVVIIGSVIFVIAVVSIPSKGILKCSFGQDGYVLIENTVKKAFKDIEISIFNEDGTKIAETKVDKKDFLLAKETLKKDMTDGMGVTVNSIQKIDGEKIYWKYMNNINRYGLSTGKYYLEIELQDEDTCVDVLNKFILQNGKFVYGKDEIIKQY